MKLIRIIIIPTIISKICIFIFKNQDFCYIAQKYAVLNYGCILSNPAYR
jgi:hypothetical protein